jgi:hypothetical protein
MTTNILALPLAAMVITTGTNEDWVDSMLFLIPDGSGIVANYPQLDLRGISFQMMVRHQADDQEVQIEASTEDGTLKVGDYPDYGYLIIYIPDEVMKGQAPGTYVGDIVASDDTFARRCVTFDLTIIEGITR